MKPLSFFLLLTIILSACAPAPTPTATSIPPTATSIAPTATVPPPTPLSAVSPPSDGEAQAAATTAAQPTALPVVFVGKITGGPKPFGKPIAIAIDKQNNLYVLDAQLNAILKFDSDGKFITQWGSQGTGDGQFDFLGGGAHVLPLPAFIGDVDVDGQSNVYVTVASQNRIEKFDSTGKFLTQWGSKGAGDGQFDSPSYITTDAAGNIYVSDTGNNRIEKFDGAGKFLAQWGGYGTGEGQFSTPTDLRFDELGNLYVADGYNNRIQRFDPAGKFLLQWKAREPVALTVDRQNHIYVGNNEGISEFDGSGKLLGTWSFSLGQGDLQFQTPSGFALDNQGNIYMSDSDLKLVKKFRQP